MSFPSFQLSVIMPTYSDAKYIRQALDAILNQSYRDFELIIINDCSPDQSDSIIREYLHDERIKYLINSSNQGVVKSVNRGCHAASGKYIITVSSDDYLQEGIFETGIALLERYPEKGLCFFDVTNFNSNLFERSHLIPEIKEPTPLSPYAILRIHRRYNFSIPACTALVKKTELAKRAYFSEEAGYFCDVAAYTPIALESGAIYVPQVGAFIRSPPPEENRHTHKTRAQVLEERSRLLTYLKRERALFNLLCYSTLLPRLINYKYYTLFLRPKHWDMALPMLGVKFKLMFTKMGRKRRERTCHIHTNCVC